jgi:hypothetical protein
MDPTDASASPPGCDFCSVEEPAAWRYLCEDFTQAVGLQERPIELVIDAVDDWLACSPCRDLIEADRWPELLERYLEVEMTRVPPELTADVWARHVDVNVRDALQKLFEGFRDHRVPGPPQPVVELDRGMEM